MTNEAYLQFVNPELRPAAVEALRHLAVRPQPSFTLLPALREGIEKSLWRPPLPAISWLERYVAGSGTQPSVTVHVINAEAGRYRPAILYTHGGGFIMGSARCMVHDLQQLAQQLDCVVVAPEYRLAPEATYLGSREDNYTALKWLHDKAEELGVNPGHIAVMGESAGGGHAALLAIAARDRGEVPLAFQCLVYPMLDDRTGSTRKVPPHVGILNWSAEYNQFGWQCFLGATAGSDQVPIAGVPARTDDLAGLPPAFVGVGSLDLFHWESVEYAQRLNDTGGFAELLVVPGAFHGFDVNCTAEIVEQFNQAKLNALRRGLHT